MRNAVFSIALIIAASFPAFGQTRDNDDALHATVDALRTAGTTLVDWVLAESGGDRAFLERVETVATFDWNSCPAITLERARALVGEESAAKLRERDGWGHRLEYCLRVDRPGATGYSVGVRSPGREGRFDATSYAPAGFDLTQPDHDVVWIDGIFVTWPEQRN